MPRAYPQDCSDPGCTTRDSTGPRSAVRSSGALSMIRRQLPVFFFAGTAVGSARRAVRARVTVDEVAFAGDFLAAGLLFLAGVALVAVGSAGVAFGSSTAFSAVALVLSAATSTFSSALAATLLALAAVF